MYYFKIVKSRKIYIPRKSSQYIENEKTSLEDHLSTEAILLQNGIGKTGNIESRLEDTPSNKKRLQAIAIVSASIAGVALFRNELPEITEYFRNTFPSLSNETVSLAVDSIGNTLMAPLGFLLSNYAHDRKLDKKELLGQVAFAAAWGVIRHYVYNGLRNFDEVTPKNVSEK